MTDMNNLFATVDSSNAAGSNRGLSGTAQLTETSNRLAAHIIEQMSTDVESYADVIRESQADNSSMDNLIRSSISLSDTDVSFLEELSEQTLDGMLKSQQSKRSRCKSKAMTMDNYRSMMSAAIAEGLIRMVTGKEKSAGGARRATGVIEYTDEQLQMLSEDQEALRREIRNVQSKKSIMKSKAGFDEGSERWQSLMRVEQQLKDMRVGAAPQVVEVDTTKTAVSELLADVDLEHLKAADSKELLAKIAQMIADKQ